MILVIYSRAHNRRQVGKTSKCVNVDTLFLFSSISLTLPVTLPSLSLARCGHSLKITAQTRNKVNVCVLCVHFVEVHSAVICRKVNVYIPSNNRWYLHRIFYSMDKDKWTSIHNSTFIWIDTLLNGTMFTFLSICFFCSVFCWSLRIQRQCRKLHEFCICSPQIINKSIIHVTWEKKDKYFEL